MIYGDLLPLPLINRVKTVKSMSIVILKMVEDLSIVQDDNIWWMIKFVLEICFSL